MEGSPVSKSEQVSNTDEVITAYRELVGSGGYGDSLGGADNSLERQTALENFERLMNALPSDERPAVWEAINNTSRV